MEMPGRSLVGCYMAKARKRRPARAGQGTAQESHRWRIPHLRHAAKFLGYVHAPDEKTAIARAAEDYEVSDRLVDRLVATPENRDSTQLRSGDAFCHRMACVCQGEWPLQ